MIATRKAQGIEHPQRPQYHLFLRRPLARLVLLALLGLASACQQSLEGAPCPCIEGNTCCPTVNACYPKGECPSVVSSTWQGRNVPVRQCDALIDDLEDGTGIICEGNGRVGAWFNLNDGFGQQSPPASQGVPVPASPDDRPGSNYAMHSRYSYPDVDPTRNDARLWGAGLGVDLRYDGLSYGDYDASHYDGIVFSAKSLNSPTLLVLIYTVDTTLAAYGGRCRHDCMGWAGRVLLDDTWRQRRIAFADLVPPCTDCAFPKQELTHIAFHFVRGVSDPAELWIDDLAFYTDAN